jgi:hypothetical protein
MVINNTVFILMLIYILNHAIKILEDFPDTCERGGDFFT